jgi:uncharacterized protein
VASPAPLFLDTNVLLRVLSRDDEEKAAAALVLLQRVERGDERAVTSPLVIFETVYTLQKSYSVPRSDIQRVMLPVLRLRGLELVDKTVHINALELFASTNLSFADAYNAAFMRWRHLTGIYSWDKDFDRVAGIERWEPGTEVGPGNGGTNDESGRD